MKMVRIIWRVSWNHRARKLINYLTEVVRMGHCQSSITRMRSLRCPKVELAQPAMLLKMACPASDMSYRSKEHQCQYLVGAIYPCPDSHTKFSSNSRPISDSQVRIQSTSSHLSLRWARGSLCIRLLIPAHSSSTPIDSSSINLCQCDQSLLVSPTIIQKRLVGNIIIWTSLGTTQTCTMSNKSSNCSKCNSSSNSRTICQQGRPFTRNERVQLTWQLPWPEVRVERISRCAIRSLSVIWKVKKPQGITSFNQKQTWMARSMHPRILWATPLTVDKMAGQSIEST